MRYNGLLGAITAIVICVGAATATAQTQCPNPQTGPLVGTTGEYCLTQAEQNTVDWNQNVFMTTVIGPVTNITTTWPRRVCLCTWENPTCIWQPCALCAMAPPPMGGGASSCGFTEGNLFGSAVVYFVEYCLNMSTQGQQLMAQRAAACPVPPPPPPMGGPPAQSRIIVCACPTLLSWAGFIPPCTRMRVPVIGTAISNVSYVDCQDFANWTDTSQVQQIKLCFHVRQKSVDEVVQGPYWCDSGNTQQMQMFGAFYFYFWTPIPVDPGSAPEQNVPDDPGDGWDPDSGGYPT